MTKEKPIEFKAQEMQLLSNVLDPTHRFLIGDESVIGFCIKRKIEHPYPLIEKLEEDFPLESIENSYDEEDEEENVISFAVETFTTENKLSKMRSDRYFSIMYKFRKDLKKEISSTRWTGNLLDGQKSELELMSSMLSILDKIDAITKSLNSISFDTFYDYFGNIIKQNNNLVELLDTAIEHCKNRDVPITHPVTNAEDMIKVKQMIENSTLESEFLEQKKIYDQEVENDRLITKEKASQEVKTLQKVETEEDRAVAAYLSFENFSDELLNLVSEYEDKVSDKYDTRNISIELIEKVLLEAEELKSRFNFDNETGVTIKETAKAEEVSSQISEFLASHDVQELINDMMYKIKYDADYNIAEIQKMDLGAMMSTKNYLDVYGERDKEGKYAKLLSLYEKIKASKELDLDKLKKIVEAYLRIGEINGKLAEMQEEYPVPEQERFFK